VNNVEPAIRISCQTVLHTEYTTKDPDNTTTTHSEWFICATQLANTVCSLAELSVHNKCMHHAMAWRTGNAHQTPQDAADEDSATRALLAFYAHRKGAHHLMQKLGHRRQTVEPGGRKRAAVLTHNMTLHVRQEQNLCCKPQRDSNTCMLCNTA
jgi:hypothetical protein